MPHEPDSSEGSVPSSGRDVVPGSYDLFQSVSLLREPGASESLTTVLVALGANALIAVAKSVAAAVKKGSPVHLVWPSSGAIAVYSPIAVVANSKSTDAAQAFVDAVLSPAGQASILASGWQPVIEGTPGWNGAAGPQVSPDWSRLGAMKESLLTQYHAIFGG